MSDKKDLEQSTASTNDPELDDLLNSALEDFSKKPTESQKSQEACSGVSKAKAEASIDDGAGGETTAVATDPPEWTDEFIKQAAAQFETNMQNLLGGAGQEISPEQLQQNFHRMAEAAAQVMSNPTALEPNQESNDFASTISQTLQNLSLGAENLQNPFSEQDIVNMFGGSSSAPDGAGNAFVPFMQGMMQSLLSKEVLYPSLKDILDRYPAWLENNRPQLEESELERYMKQMNLMKEVCAELEQEKNDDPENMKRERFDRVLQLMQKMQDLGHPPADLVGDSGPGLQFDGQGNPVLPADLNFADPNQCLLM